METVENLKPHSSKASMVYANTPRDLKPQKQAPKLNLKTFLTGQLKLAAVFPSLGTSQEIAAVRHELLNDLEPEDYDHAIEMFCKTQEQVFNGTNVIAILRKHALENASRRREILENEKRSEQQKKDEQERVPMPEYFRERFGLLHQIAGNILGQIEKTARS